MYLSPYVVYTWSRGSLLEVDLTNIEFIGQTHVPHLGADWKLDDCSAAWPKKQNDFFSFFSWFPAKKDKVSDFVKETTEMRRRKLEDGFVGWVRMCECACVCACACASACAYVCVCLYFERKREIKKSEWQREEEKRWGGIKKLILWFFKLLLNLKIASKRISKSFKSMTNQ